MKLASLVFAVSKNTTEKNEQMLHSNPNLKARELEI